MKGIALALFGFFVVVVSAAAAGDDFNLTVTSTNSRDPAAMIWTPRNTSGPLALLVTDDRTEARGGKPTIAYTIWRFSSKTADVSVQPVIGSINGAQVRLNF